MDRVAQGQISMGWACGRQMATGLLGSTWLDPAELGPEGIIG